MFNCISIPRKPKLHVTMSHVTHHVCIHCSWLSETSIFCRTKKKMCDKLIMYSYAQVKQTAELCPCAEGKVLRDKLSFFA